MIIATIIRLVYIVVVIMQYSNTFRWDKFGELCTKQEQFTQETNIIIITYAVDVAKKDFTIISNEQALEEEGQNKGTT